MRPHIAKSVPWSTFTSLPLLAVLVPVTLSAAPKAPQGSESASEGRLESPAKASENTEGAEGAEGAKEKQGSPTPDVAPVPPSPSVSGAGGSSLAVERLPAEAWPAPKTRGIHGGSLWLSAFHGLQWPYIPKTGIGISGSAWIDTGYQRTTHGAEHQISRYRLQQGRAVLRLTPTYAKGRFFVQAQGELVADQDQSTTQPRVGDTDDLWVRVGTWNSWDLQVGRYEGWELYHLGMGMDLNTLERQGATPPSGPAPPDFYGTTFGFYRSSNVGNVGLHLYPTNFLRFELLGQVGNDLTTGFNTLGARPAAILDFGIIRIKGGAEYRVAEPRDTLPMTTTVLDANGIPVLNPDGTMMTITTQVARKERNTEKGFGGTIQLILDPHFEMGVSAAQGYVKKIDLSGGVNTEGTYTVTSIGGFANLRIVERLIAGAGAHWTTLVDEHVDSTGKYGYFAHLQTFGALQYLVSGQLFVKAVVGYARGPIEPSFQAVTYTNTMLSGRLRVMYLF